MTWDVNAVTTKWAQEQKLSVQSLPNVTSTNDWAKETIHAALAGGSLASRALFTTGHQTRGRGRGTHTWTDTAAGVSLLSSWVFQLRQAPSALTAPRAGLAVIRAARTSFPKLNLSLKAPNDLYCAGQKMAGLLLENIQQGEQNWLVVGLGLNVWEAPELEGDTTAISLSEACPYPLTEKDWQNFLQRLHGEFEIFVAALESTSSHQLSPSEQQDLLFYLNLHPHLASPYREISAQGDLRSDQGVRAWTEI